MEQENFSLGHSGSVLFRMTSHVVHHVGVYFPGKVVRDAVWERTGGLGTNFAVYISETAVLPLLSRTRKKVSLECSHKITPAVGMSVYLRLFGRCFYPKCPFGKGNKAEFVINLPMDLSRGKSKLWLPFGQQRAKVRKSRTGEVGSGEEVGSCVWRERAVFWVGRSGAGTSGGRHASRTRRGNFAFGGED